MKIAVLGAGKIARALVGGIVRSGLCPVEEITVSDKSSEARRSFEQETKVRAVADNAAAVRGAGVTLLCVKPQDAVEAVSSASESLDGQLLISVAAGIHSSTLATAAPETRIIRAMPNTAALIGRSATAIAPGQAATQQDLDLAEKIFRSVGLVVVTEEHHLHAVTGLSGSGPAYFYLVVEALMDGAVAEGLTPATARALVAATMSGTAEMLASSTAHPAALREAVTSPGGTTIAGLLALERAGTRAAFAQAVRAASARSRELADS